MTLGEYIAQQVQAALENAFKTAEPDLAKIAGDAGTAASGGLLGDVGRVTDIVSSVLGDIPVVGGLLGDIVDPLKPVEDAAGKFGGALGLGYVLGYLASPVFQPLLLPLVHAINAQTTNEIFDPQTAAQLVARGIITQEFAFSEASGGGLDNQHEGSLIEAARNYPALGEVLQMLNRGMITNQQALTALQRDGLHPDYVDAALSLRDQLLSPADLALAALRGIITTEEAYTQAHTMGYANDQVDLLIGNTGEPPGIMEMLFLYRRKLIDEATLVRAIKQSRIRDEWVQSVIDLRYAPMSTADAVRAVVENYMTPEEGQVIAEQNGLEPDHWKYLYESWGRPLAVGEMLRLYHLGKVTIDDVKQAIRESDIKDKYVDVAVDLGRRLLGDYRITQMVQEGVITHDEAMKLLEEQGYTPEDAVRIINLGTAKRIGSHHTLTKSDTLTMYTDALITRDQAMGYLTALGYTADLAKQMLDLADYKRKAALIKITMKGIEAELKAHRIDEHQAKSQLVTAGLDPTQAQIYVDEWMQTLKVATRTLTEAQTLKACVDGVISTEECKTRLLALGLSDADVTVLFKLEGLEKYTPLKNIVA